MVVVLSNIPLRSILYKVVCRVGVVSDNYRFQVLGPFRVPTIHWHRRRRIDFSNARDAVFEQAQEVVGSKYDICDAIGCYVFGLKPPGGSRSWPYYVGQAADRKLYKRVFELLDKPQKYDDIVWQFERATPFVYLLPLLSPGGGLARRGSAQNKKRIDLAEQQLIGMALRVNPDLWNVQHRRALESFTIDGISKTPGRRSSAATLFRAMIDRPQPKEMRATAPEAGTSEEERLRAEQGVTDHSA
jgi:hypothetical protein